MPTTIKTFISCLLLSALTLTASAVSEVTQENFEEQYKRFLTLYSDEGSDAEAFFKQSELLKQYYRKTQNLGGYYSVFTTEVLYDTQHGMPYKAIQRTNEMLEEMNAENYEGYHLVHMALGTIFQDRGNTSMAQQYFQQAVDETTENPRDHMVAHSRMAFLLMTTDPNKADYWNEKNREISLQYPSYHQAYLFISACIKFTVSDKTGFYSNYDEYQNYRSKHEELDNFGTKTMEIMKKAFDGETEEALRELTKPNSDINDIMRHDMRITIFRMGNDLKSAVDEMICHRKL